MTREEILNVMRRTPNVGAVAHEDFADYAVVLEQRRKIDDEWTTAESVYMAVDGKLAMANEDHRRQGKRFDFGEPKVLVDNETQLTLLVTVTSELYGTRHGIATSRRVGGTQAEREFPWEVAETSAIGRALTAMGYGLLPGAGLASAEDMLRTNVVQTPKRPERAATGGTAPGAPGGTGPQPARRQPLVSAVQRQKLSELYRHLHGGSEADALRGLDALFAQAFGHPLNEATYEEGARITAQLMSTQREARSS